MSKEPWVRPEIKNRIAELADVQPKMRAPDIRRRVEQEYSGTGYYVPKPEYFRKEVSKLRRHRNRTDEPWSIGATFHDVHPAHIKTVVAVWKWALLMGFRFTIRQAKWVALLDDVVQQDNGQVDVEGLYDWATRYAARQKAKEAAQKKESTEVESFDTADLDAKLAFSNVGYQAMVDTGLVTEPTIDRDVGERVAMDPKWVLRSAWKGRNERLGGDQMAKDQNERLIELLKAIPDDKLVDTNEVVRIWWLAIIGSVGWRNLPVQRQNDVIVELLSEIVSWCDPKPSIFHDLVSLTGSGYELPFMPSDELLAEVGYVIHGWRNLDNDDD